ncbi:uncharacterized protein LTR77_005464 [Saxophila tyrrhenica]|uniref:Uncharacterized protein n=1 Tax=Saxophila tyrrhenica TaxID=1690608 RepID=A0AAV9P9B9_9PEZI|nr:hypothetical protein LTR77_005464 [Saxophila tyrrhenica]
MYKLPHNAFSLLEYYFAFTHSWLPMTEKATLLKIMYSYPSDGLPLGPINSADHAELWSVMALAATQTTDNTASDAIEQIRRNADSLLPCGNSPYEVPHIRALMLRAVDDLHRFQLLSAWLRLGGIGSIDEDGLDEWEPWSDPLVPPGLGTEAKIPTRAFSTLNELVRYYSRLIEDDKSAGVHNNATDNTDECIVTTLLRNAASKQGRVQPSEIVTVYYKTMERKGLGWTSNTRPDLNPAWSLPDNFPPEPQDINLQPVPRQSYPFMTMPNESDQPMTGLDQTETNMFWPMFQSPLQQSNTPAGGQNAAMDVFDELATLERQESAHHPHFMQNLGFPDLDLAEFFGPDYQTGRT